MDDPANPVRINEKWIVIIIWTALLTLLYFTTANGAVTGFGGNVRDFYASFFTNGGFPSESLPIKPIMVATSVVALVLSGVLVYQLFDAWSKFISLTNQILIAFVESSMPGERNPILFELLNFRLPKEEEKPEQGNELDVKDDIEDQPEEEVIETAPDQAIGSVIGSVLKAVAISWAIIIVTPGIIILVSLIGR